MCFRSGFSLSPNFFVIFRFGIDLHGLNSRPYTIFFRFRWLTRSQNTNKWLLSPGSKDPLAPLPFLRFAPWEKSRFIHYTPGVINVNYSIIVNYNSNSGCWILSNIEWSYFRDRLKHGIRNGTRSVKKSTKTRNFFYGTVT